MPNARYDSAHHQQLNLGYGFSFNDLYDRDGLVRLDAAFLDFLEDGDTALHAQLEAARLPAAGLAGKAQSELLIALAPHLEDFLARLFGIETQVQALSERHHELAPLYSCKRLFVQRRAMAKAKPDARDTTAASCSRCRPNLISNTLFHWQPSTSTASLPIASAKDMHCAAARD